MCVECEFDSHGRFQGRKHADLFQAFMDETPLGPLLCDNIRWSIKAWIASGEITVDNWTSDASTEEVTADCACLLFPHLRDGDVDAAFFSLLRGDIEMQVLKMLQQCSDERRHSDMALSTPSPSSPGAERIAHPEVGSLATTPTINRVSSVFRREAVETVSSRMIPNISPSSKESGGYESTRAGAQGGGASACSPITISEGNMSTSRRPYPLPAPEEDISIDFPNDDPFRDRHQSVDGQSVPDFLIFGGPSSPWKRLEKQQYREVSPATPRSGRCQVSESGFVRVGQSAKEEERVISSDLERESRSVPDLLIFEAPSSPRQPVGKQRYQKPSPASPRHGNFQMSNPEFVPVRQLADGEEAVVSLDLESEPLSVPRIRSEKAGNVPPSPLHPVPLQELVQSTIKLPEGFLGWVYDQGAFGAEIDARQLAAYEDVVDFLKLKLAIRRRHISSRDD